MINSNKVWDILVAYCGANEDWREYFNRIWPDCEEFRFQGNQGFGGKVWAPVRNQAPYITCYKEDENLKRNTTRTNANTALKYLWEACYVSDEFQADHFHKGFPYCDRCGLPCCFNESLGIVHSTDGFPFGVPVHLDSADHEASMRNWWHER